MLIIIKKTTKIYLSTAIKIEYTVLSVGSGYNAGTFNVVCYNAVAVNLFPSHTDLRHIAGPYWISSILLSIDHKPEVGHQFQYDIGFSGAVRYCSFR